jgi:hypothetical protein
MGIYSAIKILINDNKIHYHMGIERVVSKFMKTIGSIDQTKTNSMFISTRPKFVVGVIFNKDIKISNIKMYHFCTSFKMGTC